MEKSEFIKVKLVESIRWLLLLLFANFILFFLFVSRKSAKAVNCDNFSDSGFLFNLGGGFDSHGHSSDFVAATFGGEYSWMLLNLIMLSVGVNYHYSNRGTTSNANGLDKFLNEMNYLGLGKHQFLTTLNLGYKFTSEFILFGSAGVILHNVAKAEHIPNFFGQECFKGEDHNIFDAFNELNLEKIRNEKLLKNFGFSFGLGVDFILSSKWSIRGNVNYNYIPMADVTNSIQELPELKMEDGSFITNIPANFENVKGKTFGDSRSKKLDYVVTTISILYRL